MVITPTGALTERFEPPLLLQPLALGSMYDFCVTLLYYLLLVRALAPLEYETNIEYVSRSLWSDDDFECQINMLRYYCLLIRKFLPRAQNDARVNKIM